MPSPPNQTDIAEGVIKGSRYADVELSQIHQKRRDTIHLASHGSEDGVIPDPPSDQSTEPLSAEHSLGSKSIVERCLHILTIISVVLLVYRCLAWPSVRGFRHDCRIQYELQEFPKTLTASCRAALFGGFAQFPTSAEKLTSAGENPIYDFDHTAFEDILHRAKSDTTAFLIYLLFGRDFDPPWYILTLSRILFPSIILSEFFPFLLHRKTGLSTSSLPFHILIGLVVYNLLCQLTSVDSMISGIVDTSVSWCSSFDSDNPMEHCLIEQWSFADQLLWKSIYITFITISRRRQRNRSSSLLSIASVVLITVWMMIIYLVLTTIFTPISNASFIVYMSLFIWFMLRLWRDMRNHGFRSKRVRIVLFLVYFCVTRFLLGWSAAIAAFGATRHRDRDSVKNFVCKLDYLERVGKYYTVESTAWNHELSHAVAVSQRLSTAAPDEVSVSMSVSTALVEHQPDDIHDSHSDESSVEAILDHLHRANEHRAHLNLSLPLWAGFVICLNESGQLEHFEEFQREREAVNLTGALYLKSEGIDLSNASISVSMLGVKQRSTTTIPREGDEDLTKISMEP